MKEIVYNNFKLFIPDRYVNDNLLNRFENNKYEKEESYLVSKYFDKNDNVLEVGSCLGYVTCLLSKNVNKVISVEANPELKKSLNRCKIENNLENVQFINKFLSNNQKEVTFQTYDLIVAGSGDRNDNAGSQWSKSRKDYIVECLNINDVDNINDINSLVIDCEGGELNFFNENSEFLKQINKICIELHEFIMYRGFNNKVINVLLNNNFIKQENIDNTYIFIKNDENK